MLDSVLLARDRFLNPGGSLFPSHAVLYLAPVGDLKMFKDKRQQVEADATHWESFVDNMKNQYQTDFSCVHKEYTEEQRKYHLQTGSFVHLEPKFLHGSSGNLLELDLSVTRL